MDENRFPKRAFKYKPVGKINIGRPECCGQTNLFREHGRVNRPNP